jgi:predicted metal-dependent peptidase
MKEKSTNRAAVEALGDCIQWACSPRGGNNFYGRILNGCGRQALPGLGTCGVRLDRQGRYLMAWDPDWFVEKERPFQLMVMVHEAAHLMLRHIERGAILKREMLDDKKANRMHEVFNVAMDMAANDISIRPMVDDTRMRFKEFRDILIWPESREYPKGKTFEEYLALLLDDLKEHGWDPNDNGAETPSQSGQGSGQGGEGKQSQGSGKKKKSKGQGSGQGKVPQWFQDILDKKHRSVNWDKIFDDMTDGEVQRVLDRAKREAKKITRQAVNQTNKSQGTVPGGIQSTVDDLLADPIIPWQEVLRGMLKSEVSQKLDESTAYPSIALMNRDDIEPYPGYQKNFTFNILAAFDTSGSMGEDEFIDCCVELRGLLEKEEGVTVRLLQFDWSIQHEEELTSDDVNELKRSYSRHGHGGTSFSAPLKYALHIDEDEDWVEGAEQEEQHGGPFDLMLMFTDGYAPIPLPDLDPKIPLFWVLTEDGNQDDLMKFVLRMD